MNTLSTRRPFAITPILSVVTAGFAVALLVGCGSEAPAGEPAPSLTFDPGTEADRAALFDYLVESTLERDAFASLPYHPAYREHPAGIDVAAEMERYRDELLAADSDSAFYYALLKISHVRKDRHLRLHPVEGGLTFPDSFGIEESLSNTEVEDSNTPRAPIRLRTDFQDPDDPFLFVGDRSREAADGAYGPPPGLGDRVRAINGMPADEYREVVRPYHRYSTEPSFLWWWSMFVPVRGVQIPARFYGDALTLTLEARDGSAYEVEMPYLDSQEIEWEGHSQRRYPGFSFVPELSDNGTYDLYVADDPGLPLIILQWRRFESDLPEAMDALVEWAEVEGRLDHHVVLDATRSGGGSRGAYAVQRLQTEPFRTTFGNMKVSDGMQRWVEDRIESIRAEPASARETVDGGSWLLEWLEEDVTLAIQEGRLYTNDVPFKGAHAPKWADGILDPAPLHFTGGLTVWLGPEGGSHLDQFASQVRDNELGHIMGMPAGGYSNTWQYEEVLRFPTNDRPIVGYMWSMGHTIRPNKEILQYNAAEVHEYIPQTRDNYHEYHPELLRRTLDRVGLPHPAALADGNDAGP